MSSDARRLFKLPRRPWQWPLHIYLLIALLVLAVTVVVWLVILVKPGKFPPTEEANQWAAEAAIIGGGALFFAVVATAIAVVAYINSTEKPDLWLTAEYPGQDALLPMKWTNSQPDESGQVVSSAQHDEWSVAFGLHNDGPVAARFAALYIVFGPGVEIYSAGAGDWLAPWRPRSLLATTTNELWWEGGADAVVHAHWSYEVLLRAPLDAA